MMSLWRNFLEDPFYSTGGNVVQTKQTNWMPQTDIKETDQAIVFHAELPGLTLDDVNVEMNNNILTIRGEKRREEKEEKENYHRVERSFGSFYRSFQLPEGVQEDSIKANLRNGVLEVCVKKPEKNLLQNQGPKKIQIEYQNPKENKE